MGFIKAKENCLFDTEACWSYADQKMLCLDTGTWRTQRPMVDFETCNCCGFCFIYCPVQCIRQDQEKFTPDFKFCKGCGVCAKECPKKAIQMISEGAYADECLG